MQKIDAMNWMEQWASRHDVRVRSHGRIRPGERRAGLVMEIVNGQRLSAGALAELLAMEGQLTFSEMEPVPALPGPASGARERAAPAQARTLCGDEPADTNRAGRLTVEPLKGFAAGSQLFVAVDQYTLVGRGDESRKAAQAMVTKYLGEGQLALFAQFFHKESWRWDGGAALHWSEGRSDWVLHVTGQSLQLVGEARHIEFLLECDRYRHHCTRVDPRADDYSRGMIDLDQVEAAMEAANFVGPRLCEPRKPRRRCKGGLETLGKTLYFGSRHSVLVRFYDKGLESDGLINSIRFEAEYHGEKADAAWVKLIEAARFSTERYTRAVGEVLCGSIDFVEKAGAHGHVDRMQRLPWWSAIVDALGRVVLRVEKAVSTLNSAVRSCVRQYGKKLARAVVVAEAMGHDLLMQFALVIERLRDGQELEDVDLSPMELAFKPVAAFVPGRRC